MYSLDPITVVVFSILLVSCSFAMGWMVGYESCRSKMQKSIRESWEAIDFYMHQAPVDTTYEPVRETVVYNLSEFRDRKKTLQKDKEVEETLEWELVWSDEDCAYMKVPTSRGLEDSDDSI